MWLTFVRDWRSFMPGFRRGQPKTKRTCPSCAREGVFLICPEGEGPVSLGACSWPYSLGPRSHPAGAERPTPKHPSDPGQLCSHQAWEEAGSKLSCELAFSNSPPLPLSSAPGVPEAQRQTPDSNGKVWGGGNLAGGVLTCRPL